MLPILPYDEKPEGFFRGFFDYRGILNGAMAAA